MLEGQWLQLVVFALVLVAAALYWYSQKGKSANEDVVMGQMKNLTALAKAGKLDAVVGRDEEIDRLIQIIQRKSKNNPLLVGEPGVGKTAIVEGFAVRVARGQVPKSLQGKQVFELSVAELIAGTKYRGEFEERLRAVMKELERNSRQSILFIDEIHLLEQTKGVEGAISASDVLKPALARGELSVIGATTLAEYEEYIRPNPALDRRFQPVLVAEPSPSAALAVLRGVARLYEQHHDVVIEDDALKAAVDLSALKLPGRRLPDKAIDVMDEAAAKVAIEMQGAHARHVGVVHAASVRARKRVAAERRAIGQEIVHLRSLGKTYPGSPALMSAEHDLEQYEATLRVLGDVKSGDEGRARVTRRDIEEVIAEWAQLAKAEK